MTEKEIWMEKLIELLNEYEPRIAGDGEHYDNIWWYRHFMSDKTVANNATRYIVSKEYGFIKRLVENNKIDTDPIRTRVKRVYVELEPREFTPQDFVDRLIMLLSISDTPIEDLISYLK